MNNIIVAFPKAEIGKNIKKVLAQSGYQVNSICTTGAQALAAMEGLETGIIISGPRFVDMMYTEIYEYLSPGFQMLLIAKAQTVMEKEVDNLVCLSMPFKVHELLQTMDMMNYTISRYKKKQRQKPKIRSKEEQNVIQNAKALLIERNGMTEEEAHKYIQKRSMDNGTNLTETAQMILSLLNTM